MTNEKIEAISNRIVDEVWNSPFGLYIQDDLYNALVEAARSVIDYIMEQPLPTRLTKEEIEKVKEIYKIAYNTGNEQMEFHLRSIFGKELFTEFDE